MNYVTVNPARHDTLQKCRDLRFVEQRNTDRQDHQNEGQPHGDHFERRCENEVNQCTNRKGGKCKNGNQRFEEKRFHIVHLSADVIVSNRFRILITKRLSKKNPRHRRENVTRVSVGGVLCRPRTLKST